MAAIRHLGFFIHPFGTTHDMLMTGCICPANVFMMWADVSDILQFSDFSDLAGKCLLTPILGRFWGIIGNWGYPVLTPNGLVLTIWVFFTSVSLLVKIQKERRP